MKFIFGFIFAWFFINSSPTTIAYMVQYLNSLHKVVEDKVIEKLEKMPPPKRQTHLESA